MALHEHDTRREDPHEHLVTTTAREEKMSDISARSRKSSLVATPDRHRTLMALRTETVAGSGLQVGCSARLARPTRTAARSRWTKTRTEHAAAKRIPVTDDSALRAPTRFGLLAIGLGDLVASTLG